MATNPRYRRIAIIGTGPSGLSAVDALSREKTFDKIRIFERRDRIGGTWLLDPIPDPFPIISETEAKHCRKIPQLSAPSFTDAAPEDTTRRTGIYDGLDSNVGAGVMEFTHTPFPKVNSLSSVQKYGPDNSTRPATVVAKYLEDLFTPHLHLITFNTTVERVEKVGKEWLVTLRQSGRKRQDGGVYDYWWTEIFDAVIVATGHYGVVSIPHIPGLADFQSKYPERLEHSKAFRKGRDYADKRVVVVGGNISASELVSEFHNLVKGQLHVSQRGSRNALLEHVWTLPNVKLQPQIAKLSTDNNGTVHFTNGTSVSNVDRILFAIGYHLSYPFITPNPVVPTDRLAGFYQHIFKIDDPSLAFIGQAKAALSFRVYEYQAVAVARYFAGRGHLPIDPDYADYYDALRNIAGRPAKESDGYELPPYDNRWVEYGASILIVKDNGTPTGSDIKLGNIDAYIASPTGNVVHKDTAIAFLTDVFGIWQNAKLLADLYAANGYYTIIPDQFRGSALMWESFGEVDLAKWLEGHKVADVEPVVDAALKHLAEKGFTKIGAVRYCFGAKYVARYLAKGRGFTAGYVAHPSFVAEDELTAITGPFSIAAAENDDIFTTELRHRSEVLLKGSKIPYQSFLYGNVDHGFAVRFDLNNKIEVFAQKTAFQQAISWFEDYLL